MRVAFSNTTPLREEIDRVVPSRPFRVEFWDGSSLPATQNGAGPTFTVRSPKAVAQALAAPGQLGLGPRIRDGHLGVDDIDAVTGDAARLVAAADRDRRQAKLMDGAVRAAGLTLPPRPPAAEFRPRAGATPAGGTSAPCATTTTCPTTTSALFLASR